MRREEFEELKEGLRLTTIGVLGIVTFGAFWVVMFIHKGILERITMSIDRKINRRRVTAGAIVSAVCFIPFLHFLVYLDGQDDWLNWYLSLGFVQGIIWYVFLAPSAWALNDDD